MESRKYQLQKQIIEALQANDNDLYSLLKSQWAHRFGVESLEELKSIDLNELNQKPTNVDVDVDNQKIDQSQEKSFEGGKAISIKDDDNQEKEIKNKEVDSFIDLEHQAFKIKSYEIVDKEKNKNNYKNSAQENKNSSEIKALIPLPPKPKYSYLNKWLLKSKF
ncbi:hypothetical protein [Prochlorococcus marinus]|uniref:hypothetical protein n=1 Tax=Prochlorococcus marinus TaxID=1219 RepID=UPI0022B380DF|nr:hypothetical protein [Prochlorococcus marinus]